MRDRIVQHPNRYKLTNVSGDIYDLTPEPGIVTEPGTDISKANLLKDATAALYGLDSGAVPDDVLAAIPEFVKTNLLLFEKIRDIADATATTTLSIDVSDIDWNVWQEIRLVGSITASAAANVYIRINTLSSSYASSTISPTATTIASDTTAFHYVGIGATLPIDIKLTKYTTNGGVLCVGAIINTPDTIIIGRSPTIAAFSTINFVSYNAGPTIGISGASLWGVRK